MTAARRSRMTHSGHQGIRQFLDIGSGMPTLGHVHEVAQAVDANAR
ncbi:SAM-dependent methyltransferase, partial [Amycolatopsis sp. NPDC003731]